MESIVPWCNPQMSHRNYCQKNKLIKNTLFGIGKNWSAPELHKAKRWKTVIINYSMEWWSKGAITQSQILAWGASQHFCLETVMGAPNTTGWLINYFQASRLTEWMNWSNSFADKSSETLKHSSLFWTVPSIELLWLTVTRQELMESESSLMSFSCCFNALMFLVLFFSFPPH